MNRPTDDERYEDWIHMLCPECGREITHDVGEQWVECTCGWTEEDANIDWEIEQERYWSEILDHYFPGEK